jgi:predicted HD phosphohydrolase
MYKIFLLLGLLAPTLVCAAPEQMARSDLKFFNHSFTNESLFVRIDSIIDTVFEVLGRGENQDYIGEDVSQLTHALEAAQLAREDGASDTLILASLVHDTGHTYAPEDGARMGDYGAMDHDQIGAEWLKSLGFGPEITDLVAGHVQAKRYLVATDQSYYDKLSAASKETLKMQGGPMTSAEVEAFKAAPFLSDKVRLRTYDERAKIVGWTVPDLESYRPLFRVYLKSALVP